MGQWDITTLKGILDLMHSVPLMLKNLYSLSIVFIAADGITGIVRYIVAKKVSSSKMRYGALAKLSCYFGLVILGAGASLVVGNYSPSYLAIGVILGAEVSSILENTTIFAIISGIPLGIFTKFVIALASIFEATQSIEETKTKGILVQSTTVFPKDKGEPVQEALVVTDVPSQLKPPTGSNLIQENIERIKSIGRK